MSAEDISEVSVNLSIRLDGAPMTLRNVVLGNNPIVVIEPSDAQPDGVLSFDVDATAFGDSATELADALELLVEALRGTETAA